MTASIPVYINKVACLNAVSDDVAGLLNGVMVEPLPLPFDSTKKGYLLQIPSLPSGIFDRKIQRNIEPQAHRLLYCVTRLLADLKEMSTDPARLGLAAAVPEVDAPSPNWDAVQAVHHQPEKLLTHLFTNTPPLHALMLLNSSVMAYVAEAFNCHGAMGGFCSQNNAGIDAVVEAFHQVSSGVTDTTLVISSSPNITPSLYLRDPSHHSEILNAENIPLKGEGAAALITSNQYTEGSVRIVAFVRGYSGSDKNEDFFSTLLANLFKQVNIPVAALDFVIGAQADIEKIPTLKNITHFSNTAVVTGDLGPGSFLTDIGLAIHVFNQQQFKQKISYGLLLTSNAAGHCSAILFSSNEHREAI